MRCPWCHNPEGINTHPELVWSAARCIGHGQCVEVCPRSALCLTRDGLVIDRDLCDRCGKCAEHCPASALEVLGKQVTVDDVAKTVVRDKVFYEKSNGGMTVSGGEPSLQAKFSEALMRAVHQRGIHVALDTSAAMRWESLGSLVELADLILLDLKLMDEDRHLEYTGIPLELVLTNAREIAKVAKPIWVRTPVIPGYTDREDNIGNIARFIRQYLPTVTRYDLLAFNKVCIPKYKRLGLAWELEERDMVTEQTMEKLAHTARDEGLEFVHWSGMTAGRTTE